MKTTDIIRGARRLLLAAIGGSAMLAFTATPALAAPGGNGGNPGGGGGGKNPTCSITMPNSPSVQINQYESVTYQGTVSGGTPSYTVNWTFQGGDPASAGPETVANSGGTTSQHVVTYNSAGQFTTTMTADDSGGKTKSCQATVSVNAIGGGNNNPPTLAPIGNQTIRLDNDLTFGVTASDPDGNNTLTLSHTILPTGASFQDNGNGSGTFTWLGATPVGEYNVTFTVDDNAGFPNSTDSETITIYVTDEPPPPGPAQTDFKIMMNYELGMHCTGFEFAYCCVLPVYNSILAQVVKPNKIDPNHNGDYAHLLDGTSTEGTDGLGRQTVLRDLELDSNGNFKKYVLKYWHEAQPRNDGNGATQGGDRMISAVEGNSLMAWNTVFDSAALDEGVFRLSGTPIDPTDESCIDDPSVAECPKHPLYNGAEGVMLGDGDTVDKTDNYQNAIWNHLYIYADLEGSNPNDSTLEKDKIRLGVTGQSNGIFAEVAYSEDCGPAFHPMGPTTQGGDPDATPYANDCALSNGNVLTYSGEHGTIVYTQMKVLENLEITLTSPRIWEALGLPLTPFEDSIDFFAEPGLIDETSVRPFVAMKAQLYHYDGENNSSPVLDSNDQPVIGFGTAPIDIPNCERCHSNGPSALNSPNTDPDQWAAVLQEYQFWISVYPGMESGYDWYARLKSAAISMLYGHDAQHGTDFTTNYPACGTDADPPSSCGTTPQNTRLGHESVICQRCHADNVIAVVKSATHNGQLIPPVTEAIHTNHKSISEVVDTDGDFRDDVDGAVGIVFNDSHGRSGGCQGCHPAHRSSGDMNGYPINLDGSNYYAASDNRSANGGCFVGRDVHSNPQKDDPVIGGVDTPEYLNPVGQWLSDNVFNDGHSTNGGLWCTNCHQQFSQEMWKAENVESLVHAQPGDAGHVREPAAGTLDSVRVAVNAALKTNYSLDEVKTWLDPGDPLANLDWGTRLSDTTHAIWQSLPQPGLCAFLVDPTNPANDANVATVEVAIVDDPEGAPDQVCSTTGQIGPIDCSGVGGPVYNLCGEFDDDGDFSVNALSFCTTEDCVTAAQSGLTNSSAVPVPFSAATDGRDHWLAAGEPHCADCHAAPYVEQSGNINAFTPFNYPRKASLMRYSRGHQDITCQGCHESIHGLYPVTPDIDTTTYAQAASLNHDGSHGPLKCGTCHQVNGAGVPSHIEDGLVYDNDGDGQATPIKEDYDAAVSWMHTFTAEADLRDDYCLNCHQDNRDLISYSNRTWTEHSYKGRSSREMMDKAESLQLNGQVAGDPAEGHIDPTGTVCTSCHGDRSGSLSRRGCTEKWRNHLIQGRASEEAWVYMSKTYAGDTCGW